MSGWSIVYNQGETEIPTECSFRNVTGFLVKSVARVAEHLSGSHTPPAGIFVLTAESENTVSIAAKDSYDLKSPALFTEPVTIVADGVTPNLNVIPGLSIVFWSNLSAGWISDLGIGSVWDTEVELWNRITSLGLGLAGLEGAEDYVTVLNDTGEDQTNCRVVMQNGARVVNAVSASRPLFAFRQTEQLNPVAHTDLLGKAITFANLVEGSPNTVDVLVDGDQVDVYDVTNSDLIVQGLQLLCDGTTVYRFANGTDYQSCEFILSSALTVADTTQIYVSDGGTFVEIYSESTGEWVSGSAGTYLTAANCGLGVVPAGESAEFRIRLLPPEGKTTALNQRQLSIQIYSEGL